MSYTVNELFAATAHLMLPFVLMDAPENMDFVKDATCVLFIAQLDTLQVVAPDHEIPLEEEELPRLVQDEIPGQEEKELPLLEVEIPMPGRVMKKKRRKKKGSRGNNSSQPQEELLGQTPPAQSIQQRTLPKDTADSQLSASV